jgi:hypothetical protein
MAARAPSRSGSRRKEGPRPVTPPNRTARARRFLPMPPANYETDTRLSILGTCLTLSAASSSWPQFRGPNSSGVAGKDKPPVQFSETTNLLWKVNVPAGLSSPCIAGDRIFLTAFESGKLFALCFDRRDGRSLAPGSAARQASGSSQDKQPCRGHARDGRPTRLCLFRPVRSRRLRFPRQGAMAAVPAGYVMNGSGTSPAISAAPPS